MIWKSARDKIGVSRMVIELTEVIDRKETIFNAGRPSSWTTLATTVGQVHE